jgi:hypothetical protein
MSSSPVRQAGIMVEQLVSKLGATLKGPAATNHADYYDYDKGIYDGIASCLQAINEASKNDDLRFRTFISGAIDSLRRVDPARQDPDAAPDLISALVNMLVVIEALSQKDMSAS